MRRPTPTFPPVPPVPPVLVLIITLALALTGRPAQAWLAPGHMRMTRAALQVLPPQVPAFFRQGGDVMAGVCIDPDTFRIPQLQELTVEEGPEHFFDLELVKGQKVPVNRYAFIQLCDKLKLEPSRVGMLPYSVTEWTQRLAVAFAHYRRWPDEPGIQARCLVYGGILAHYAEDLTQPLHVTVHYDGRADSTGRSPRSGLHLRVDALPGRLDPQSLTVPPDLDIHAYPEVMAAVLDEIKASNALVDRVYTLQADFPSPQGPWTPTPGVRDFGVERFRAAVRLTDSLFLTAWEMSAKLQVPDWSAPEEAAATQPVVHGAGK